MLTKTTPHGFVPPQIFCPSGRGIVIALLVIAALMVIGATVAHFRLHLHRGATIPLWSVGGLLGAVSAFFLWGMPRLAQYAVRNAMRGGDYSFITTDNLLDMGEARAKELYDSVPHNSSAETRFYAQWPTIFRASDSP